MLRPRHNRFTPDRQAGHCESSGSCSSHIPRAHAQTPPPSDLPRTTFAALDLASQSSVRSLVSSWSLGPITSLILNAGISPGGGPKYTSEGVETAFAINHLNHALLFFLLNQRNLLAPDCRIVFVTTALTDPQQPLNRTPPHWTDAKEVAEAKVPEMQNGMVRYSTTKLGGMYFGYALARRVTQAKKGWTVIVYEPGFVPGNGSKLHRGELLRRFKSPVLSADAPGAVHAIFWIIPRLSWLFRRQGITVSTPPESGKAMEEIGMGTTFADAHGKYIMLHTEKPSCEQSYDEAKQEELWRYTVNTLGQDDAEKKAFDTI